jgi:hypothetical protein
VKVKACPGVGTVNAYQDQDLDRLKPVFQEASALWHDLWRQSGKGDWGSACLGNGLAVWYLGPKKRKVTTKIVVGTPTQGSAASEAVMQPVIKFLNTRGVDVHYEYGRMD